MSKIQRRIAAIRDDHRAGYLFDTKDAAAATGMVPNKFGTWWRDNRAKLLALAIVDPPAFNFEFASINAEAAERIKQMEGMR